MNHKKRFRCFELIRNHAEFPKASEALKQRILLAATRARNRQRFNHQVAASVCSILFLVMTISHSIDNSLLEFVGFNQSSFASQASDNSQLVLAKPVFDWNSFDTETAILEAFIQQRSWQNSIFRKPITKL